MARCSVCGQRFRQAGTGRSRVYCSDACRMVAYRTRKRQAQVNARAEAGRELDPSVGDLMIGRRNPWSSNQLALLESLRVRGFAHGPFPNGTLFRTCRVCSSKFVPTRAGDRGPWPKDCSDDCQRVTAAWKSEQWRQGSLIALEVCGWCHQSVSSSKRRNASRYCSRQCYRAAASHLCSNTLIDRCEVPRCVDCGLVGGITAKKIKRDRSFMRRPKGRCDECHRRYLREYELSRPIGPVRDRKRHRNRVIAAGDKMSRADVIERYGNVCYLCGLEIDVMIDDPNDRMYLHIDHIVPIARGGLHTWDNVAPTHAQCNESKGTKLLAPPVG